jgi:hypothetical protein
MPAVVLAYSMILEEAAFSATAAMGLENMEFSCFYTYLTYQSGKSVIDGASSMNTVILNLLYRG